ncbi:MAG TPA: hypothetical protein VF345_02550 [Chthoniobacterales bacterium]
MRTHWFRDAGTRRLRLLAALISFACAVPLHASFHLMQIEQVIGGVNGDTTAQAVQLRMRSFGENFVTGGKLIAFDAAGNNPITLLTFPSIVSNGAAGSRILIATANFASHETSPIASDFTMIAIPASYLAAGRLAYLNPAYLSGGILWSVSWGGADYTGPNTGTLDNDADGNFGPPFAGALPSDTTVALQFNGPASAPSTNNAADYALTTGAATFTNNAGDSTSLIAGTPTPTATGTPTPTPTATPAPTATPTATPAPTPTPTPSPIPTPTPAPTATPTATPSILGNISTRLRVETGDNVLIGGFIITGTQPKKIIVRGIGPSLPLAGALADPVLELHGPGAFATITNDNWRTDQQAEIIATGIPPTNDFESAIVATLPANNAGYTAIVRGVNNGTGIGVVEAYDLDRTVDSKLGNISTRGLVQTGDNVLIAGTIILGPAPQKVIVRALGPSLDVPGKLADPTLELHDGNGALIAANDNWRTDQEAEIIATGIPPTNDLESAIVETLPANSASYTAIVRGVNNTTGVAVVEVYALN